MPLARPTGMSRPVLGLLLLTASTGAIDAVSYLALDRVFTGNMTGNVLFLGFAAVGVEGIPLLNNLVALAGFVLGSIVGGRVVGHEKAPGRLTEPAGTLLAGGGALLFALVVVWMLVGPLPEAWLLPVTLLIASVMGAQVAAVKPVGNSDITTIVVTNTLANAARESRLGGGAGKSWLPRILAVIAMGAGAALGAGAVLWWGGAWALLVSAVVYTAGAVALIVEGRTRGSDGL